jgi:hypothetical protein
MKRILITGLSALVCFGFISAAKADEIIFQQGQERIVYDSRTSEYVIEYIGNDGTLRTVRWTPATNIQVTVRSRFKQSSDRINYSYAINNLKNSLQPVLGFRVLVRGATKEYLSAPGNWRASVVKNYDDPTAGVWVSWTPNRTEYSLTPGESLSGLSMVNAELPGVGMSLARGLMSVLTYPDEGPGGALIEFMENGGFLKKASEGVSRLAIVPRISVPTPYDAATVLTNIQKHLDTDLISMKLVDPVLVAQMDPWFATAIDAAKRNNTTGLRNALQELRRLLKQECADVDQEGNETETDDKPVAPARIAKLAARVLDFDLKYVQTRVKDNKD